MTIYIDVIILENLIMNYIILYATGIIVKAKINYIRIFFASLIGAIYAATEYCSNITIYSNVILKLILSIIIIYIAFYPQNIKKMCKQLLIFYVTTFTFGGVATYLIYILKPQNIIIKNGIYVGNYILKVIEIVLNTMVDTGNMLKEPISGLPVIVVEHTKLYNVIPKEILNNIEAILGGDFNKIPENIKKEYMSKLKLIPFASLGKQNGMLLGIKAEKIEILEEPTNQKKEAIVGIYNKSLTKRGEYDALMGIELY